jgi:hypothetical protein
MSRYVIKNQITESTKTLIKKFSREVQVNNDRVRGVYTITNYRKYQFGIEVDVVFKGEIHAGIGNKKQWFSSDILNVENGKYRISKIKLNRFIRKSLVPEIRCNLNYFSESLSYYSEIKKIQWV